MSTNPVAMSPMPYYRSHKKLWALEIASVDDLGTDMTTDENPKVQVNFVHPFASKKFNLRHKPTPQAGWFYVQYEDGYESFSPPDQFKSGNTLVADVFQNAARTAHEANRLLCLAQGDTSQPSWEDAPGWQKNSALAGVRAIVNDPNTTPEQSHEGWLKQKAEDGWKYGPVKNADTKEHPCFVPYSELPEAQRLKDHMFGLVVRAALFV